LPLTRQEGALVKAAVETELVRLLGEGGVSSELAAGGAFPHMQADGIRVSRENSPEQVGQQIARAVYGGIGGSR
jgi:hypothetical protein